MLHSLRFRLLLTMSAVVLVAVGALALLSSRTTSTEFERYVQSDLERRQRIVSDLLVHYNGNPDEASMQVLVERLAGTSGEHIIVAERMGKVIADSQGGLIGQTIELPGPPPGSLIGPRNLGPEVGVTVPLSGTQDIAFGAGGYMTEAYTLPWSVRVPVTGVIPFTREVGVRIPEHITWSPVFVPLAMVPVSGTVQAGSRPANLIVARVAGPESEQGGFLNTVNQQLLFAAGAAGLVALLLTWLLSRRIVGPVEALTVAAGKMERGDLDQRVKVNSRDEIGKLAHAFNAMSEGLARQETLRRNMVGDIAHELRTPLSNIRGYLEAVRDGMVEPDEKLITSLHEESMLLSRLVEDLQELQLAEAGQTRLEKVNLELGELIEKARDALAPAATGRGVTVRIEVEPDLPTVQADRERIGQVLRNLISNAITHTPHAGEVTVSARASGGEIEVSVRDTGAGIPPEHLPNIFERFYRADGSRARSTGGAGLGLAIVKQLVALHGGRAWAESEVGKGATFYFTLPLTTR